MTTIKNGRVALKDGDRLIYSVEDGEVTLGQDCIAYYKEGLLHREDGPAIEWADGGKEWLVNGKHHRIDGPAVEGADGTRVWYLNGKLHREDGPAVEWGNGRREWYLNGERHRDGGPALEAISGTKAWYQHGKPHREDGPAVETADGDKEWWLNGRRHRLDGPAVEDSEGGKEWWIDGNKYNQNDYLKAKNSNSTDELSKALANLNTIADSYISRVKQVEKDNPPSELEIEEGKKQVLSAMKQFRRTLSKPPMAIIDESNTASVKTPIYKVSYKIK